MFVASSGFIACASNTLPSIVPVSCAEAENVKTKMTVKSIVLLMVLYSSLKNKKPFSDRGAEPESGFDKRSSLPFSFAGIIQFRFGGFALSRPVPTRRNRMHP
jgi:hypothetical protein